MNIETLRVVLLLAKAGMTRPSQVAKALGRGKTTVYRWLVWRRRPLKTADRMALLYLAGAVEGDLARSVVLPEDKAAEAARWFQMSEDEMRAAAGDVPGA